MEELTKNHWEENKRINENLILQNQMQNEMAVEVIKLCERKIAEFPEVFKHGRNKKTDGTRK